MKPSDQEVLQRVLPICHKEWPFAMINIELMPIVKRNQDPHAKPTGHMQKYPTAHATTA